MSDLARNPRYDSMRKRAELADELIPRLHAALAARSAVEWEALLKGHVPSAAVGELEDMFYHPQVEAQGLVADIPDARLGSYRGLAAPIRFSALPARQPTAAPALGEHGEEILLQHGWSVDEVRYLRSQNVMG